MAMGVIYEAHEHRDRILDTAISISKRIIEEKLELLEGHHMGLLLFGW